ncbi:hypothetical protein B0H14DRAFT_2593938 [Mycena olivaceomarginata]|nr:hypothetical protein B0H14DRAFT_2593938 [Mycena olivaceomarginata]
MSDFPIWGGYLPHWMWRGNCHGRQGKPSYFAYQLQKLSLIPTMVLQQTIWMVGEAVTDIVIATVILGRLFKATKGAVPSTQGIIARSIILTVETNALTGHRCFLTLVNPKD